MNEVSKEQNDRLSRYHAGIRAYKILNIRGNDLIFRLRGGSDKTESFPVTDIEAYQTGKYIDLIVEFNGRTSYSIRLIGKTPERFVPADGAEIGE